MESKKEIKSDELQGIINRYSPFLVEIRKRILFTLCISFVGIALGFAFYQKIIKFLVNFLSLQGVNIVFTSPFQFINLAISTAFACGLIAAFPLIIAQLLSFLKPALKTKEYKMVIVFLPFSILLFIVGFVSGAYMIKWQVGIFLTNAVNFGIGNVLDISKLISVTIITSAIMGVGFQFPIVLLMLLRLGILKTKSLSKIRPWFYLGSFIFAILLPPDSVIFDVVAALPLVFLFEFTLILNRFFDRNRASQPILARG